MSLPLWLYRTVNVDSDGCPIDFGAVRAATREDAARFVVAHLGADLEDDFYLYPIANVSAGVLPDDETRGERTEHTPKGT